MYLRACLIIVLKNILQKFVISVTRGLKLCFRGLRPCVSRSFAAFLSKLSGRSERRESAAMTRCASYDLLKSLPTRTNFQSLIEYVKKPKRSFEKPFLEIAGMKVCSRDR